MMTFTELLPEIRRLPALEKLHLIRVLAEELDSEEDVSPLQPHKVYYLATPYDTYGAGHALMNAIR